MGISSERGIQPGGGRGFLPYLILQPNENLDVDVTNQCCGCSCPAKPGIGLGTSDAELWTPAYPGVAPRQGGMEGGRPSAKGKGKLTTIYADDVGQIRIESIPRL